VQPATVPDALAAALARDPSRPLVTHLAPGGLRTELSVRTFENNVAKAANLLRDDADLGDGGTVALDLPLHWQTAVWLGACGLVGATAWLDGDPDDASVEVAVLGPSAVRPTRAPLTLATALHPLGMPFAEPLPPGVLDAAVEVRSHGDRFTAYRTVGPDEAWLRRGHDVLTQQSALAGAAGLAARLGVADGGRLLVRAATADPDALLALLALPLVMDAAVVVLDDAGADDARLAEVAAQERCTAVLP
jgi:uncharacterized protein (TIGR03089 family)